MSLIPAREVLENTYPPRNDRRFRERFVSRPPMCFWRVAASTSLECVVVVRELWAAKRRLKNNFGICGEGCHSPERPLSSPRRLAEI
jgi:hypothetical protein